MSSQPLVSILLLSMNHEAYIGQCIQSLADQTYRNIEIIYLDNFSSDSTYSVGRNLLEKSGIPFKSYQNQESKSISQNLNFLLKHSSGDYISPLSADDWFAKENIELKINYFLLHKEAGAVFSNGWIYNESKKNLVLNDSSSFKRGNIYRELLLQPDCIFYVGVLYNKKIFEMVGVWDESLIIEDVDMYVRIALNFTIDFISEPLVFYRRTEDSVSKNKTYMMRGYQQYYEKYKKVKWIDMKSWLSERYRSMAANSLNHKSKGEAGSFLKEAFKLKPVSIKNFRTLVYFFKSTFPSKI